MNDFRIRIVPAFIFLLSLFQGFTGNVTAQDQSGEIAKVPFGDPFIMLHNDRYYAYGTQSADGINVYVSDDLKTWRGPVGVKNGLALHKDDVWGDRWFWAPEVYFVNGKFYMYFSADEHINVATSDSPLGPFTQEVKKPMFENEKAIDNSLFIDDDGKPYLIFDRFNDGLNIWVAELEDNLKEIKPGTLHKCINVSQPWEEVWPRVNEGAFVIKRNGTYFMKYSANSYESPFYGIGFATAKHINGPWVKYENNPIFQKPGDLVGVGHSAFFTDREGNLRIVFHAHNSKERIHPRHMYISTVTFEEKDGKEIMKIDENYMTPVLAKVNNENTFQNPIVPRSLPDPTIIKADDGFFYLYATEDIRHTPIYKTKNLVDRKSVV